MAALRLRKFTNPDLLKTIDPHRLKAFLEPWRDYLAARGVLPPPDVDSSIDCDALAHLLLHPDGQVPREMIDALYYVDETSSTEDMDALIELANVSHVTLEGMATTVSDVAIDMWLAAPDVLRSHHAETIAFAQKHFLYFGGVGAGGRSFPAIDDHLRLRIQSELDDWFEQHRRARGCRVFLFPRGKKVWIAVRHGMPMRREATHLDNGGSATELYRPQQHDVLVYDGAVGEMAVHAKSKGETKLYLSCFGRLIFGDEDHFPSADKYTLDPLIDDGGEALVCADVEGLESARFVEYRRYWGGSYKEIEIRRASDIFAALSQRGQKLDHRGALVGAGFKLKFTGSPKERSLIIKPPASARYERDEDSELIEGWLSRRGFILDPGGQHDDNEGPDPVLEVA